MARDRAAIVLIKIVSGRGLKRFNRATVLPAKQPRSADIRSPRSDNSSNDTFAVTALSSPHPPRSPRILYDPPRFDNPIYRYKSINALSQKFFIELIVWLAGIDGDFFFFFWNRILRGISFIQIGRLIIENRKARQLIFTQGSVFVTGGRSVDDADAIPRTGGGWAGGP